MTKREIAESYFKKGYNCAQAVALAFKDEVNMDEKTLAMAVSGFGGGFGRLREVCGAVSGMVAILSMLEGSFDPKDDSQKAGIYRKVQYLANEFKVRNGKIVCRELLNLPNEIESHVPDARTKEYYKKRPCVSLVGDAAEILEDYLKNGIV